MTVLSIVRAVLTALGIHAAAALRGRRAGGQGDRSALSLSRVRASAASPVSLPRAVRLTEQLPILLHPLLEQVQQLPLDPYEAPEGVDDAG